MGNQTSTTSTRNDESDAVPPLDGFRYEKGVCALEYWDPVRVLEHGSISDIHLVRRRSKRIKVRYKEKRDIMTLAEDKNCRSSDKDSNCCSDRDDNLFVLKSVMKDHVRNPRILEEMRREIYTMSRLHHPNVIRLYEAYERRRHIYLVMEYCRGGSLFNRKFSEPQVAVIIGKILNALEYLHSKNVVHRDLKLENIMYNRGEPKIIDFGLSTKYLSEEYLAMTDRVGTLYSMAPQVLQGVYTSKCDLWSTGVVAYMLLSKGEQPFWGPPRSMPWAQRKKEMIDRILRAKYKRMTGPSWDGISQSGKDFVARLLKLDPKKRPSAKEALKDPWIIKYYDTHDLASSTTLDSVPSNVHHIERMAECVKNLRKLLVSQWTAPELVALRHKVEQQDLEGRRQIPLKEFQIILEQHITPSSAVADVLNVKDEESDSQELDLSAPMEYVDFFAHVFLDMGRHSTAGLAEALDTLDVTGTRTVSVEQLKSALNEHIPADVLTTVLQELEVDTDGNVKTNEVLEVVGREMAGHMRDSIRRQSSLDSPSDMDDANLLTVETAVIPGGRRSKG